MNLTIQLEDNMALNNNILLKELYDSIKESGWLDKATKHFQEHPEMFNDCVNSSGKIASLCMSVSYQPKSLLDVADVKPNVFISMGNCNMDQREFNVYSDGSTQSRVWINNNLVVEVNYHA